MLSSIVNISRGKLVPQLDFQVGTTNENTNNEKNWTWKCSDTSEMWKTRKCK